jgi:predicted nucleotidyltransferase
MQNKSSDSVKIYYPRYSLREIREKIRKAGEELFKLGVVKIVLFGSFAKEKATAGSDIDLLILARDQESKNKFHEIMETINIEIAEAHLYTQSEFKKLKSSESWLAKEIEKNGVTLLESK